MFWLGLWILITGALFAGCGSGDARENSDDTGARATLVAYVDALTAGRGEEACQQLTPRARSAMAAQFSSMTTCPEALRFAGALLRRGDTGARMRSGARRADIKVSGDTGEVRGVRILTPKNLLRYVDGRWYLDRR